MSLFDRFSDKKFLSDTAERASKTFAQFYLGYWLFLNPDNSLGNAPQMFDTLFTGDNLKAGVVGLALSLATSVGSSFNGDSHSASAIK